MDTAKLKDKLDELGITQYKLAKKLSLAPTTVNQWFARGSIKDTHLINICNKLKLDIKDFMPSYNK